MRTGPLVSIIIPCYNYGHLLNDAIKSVLNQTHSNWECIIVDDGSSDNTGEVVRRFSSNDPRIIYIFQSNKGLAGARNTALKAAKGQFVQFLDADDILPADKISVQLKFLIDNPNVDLVFGNVYLFEKDLSSLSSATPLKLQAQPTSGQGEIIINTLIEDNMFLVHCALFRSSLVEQIGYFNEGMITCEDWDFWFRMAVAGKRFQHLESDETIVFVRSHGVNMSSNRRNMWAGKIHFRREAASLLAPHLELKSIAERNQRMLFTLETRFELAYGSVWKGAVKALHGMFLFGEFFHTIRDSLYWMKERLLKRV